MYDPQEYTNAFVRGIALSGWLCLLFVLLALCSKAHADTTDPAYRVMTAFALNKSLQFCPNYDRAMAVTIDIVDKAEKENPGMNIDYMWRVAAATPATSQADCDYYYQTLVAISNGAVFK